MPNRLAASASPYLRQHASNPVDWYPWGEEAFARARAGDRPVLLSVGYSACHWCHVMERESFSDAETAALLNRLYVCVKVDREERPDVDQVYQAAVQVLRQSGGWPLTAFLFPDGRCFFAGTYFPDEARWGLPAFRDVLAGVERAYRTRRGELDRSAGALVDAIVRQQAPRGDGEPPGRDVLEDATEAILARVDRVHGGFGTKPKFPSPSSLRALWRRGLRTGDARYRDAVLLTLRRMADGGLRDHVGGGFHRYSTDEAWHVPHFEKMLYDNAQLAPLYLLAARETGDAALREVGRETLAYLAREMTAPDGAFYSATDADSEGEEGRFFTWNPADVRNACGDPALAEAFCRAYDVTPDGNWEEGRSVPRRVRPLAEIAGGLRIPVDTLERRLAAAREKLQAARARREAPHRDEKRIVAWNGLAIAAFVTGGELLGDEAWLDVARRAARAVLATCVRDGALLHQSFEGEAGGPAFLDDHAAFGTALLRLFEADGDRRWRDAALAVAIGMDAGFTDPAGGWWYAPEGDAALLTHRPKDAHDAAMPSGSALAAAFCQRLHAHTHEPRWLARVESTLAAHAARIAEAPAMSGHMLGVLDRWLDGFEEVVVGGEGAAPLASAARTAPGDDERLVLALDALPAEHPAAGGRAATTATAWVCRGRTCSLPVTTPEALRATLAAKT